jgi:type VI secretion system Hcp family effector
MDCFLELSIGGTLIESDCPIKKVGEVNTSKMIHCQSFSDEVLLKYRRVGGLVDSGAIYTPIIVTKEIDKASPLLAQALCDQTNIDSGKFYFFEPGPGAKKRLVFRITIERGKVAETGRTMSKDAAMDETVQFVFGKITWEHVLGKTAHTDDFREQ